MIQHFSFKPMFENSQLPGWIVTFYYKQIKYSAQYKKNGEIEWLNDPPSDKEKVEKMIHELMLFHVYD